MSAFLLLEATLGSIAENLALDDALLAEAEETSGPPVLRLWEPTDWSVVLGASGRITTDVQLDACRADGVDLGRRSSGGGTVVVGPGTVNVTVVLPRSFATDLETVEGAQHYVLERFAKSFRDVFPGVCVLGSGDLTIETQKFAGSAQRRLKTSVLVHATVLNRFPLEKLDRYLNQPRRQPVYRADRSHSAFVRNLGLPPSVLRERLLAAWKPVDGFLTYDRLPLDRIRALMEQRFADPSWVQRF